MHFCSSVYDFMASLKNHFHTTSESKISIFIIGLGFGESVNCENAEEVRRNISKKIDDALFFWNGTN